MQEGPMGFWHGSPGEWWCHLRAGQVTQDRRNRSGRRNGCLVVDVLSLRSKGAAQTKELKPGRGVPLTGWSASLQA